MWLQHFDHSWDNSSKLQQYCLSCLAFTFKIGISTCRNNHFFSITIHLIISEDWGSDKHTGNTEESFTLWCCNPSKILTDVMENTFWCTVTLNCAFKPCFSVYYCVEHNMSELLIDVLFWCSSSFGSSAGCRLRPWFPRGLCSPANYPFRAMKIQTNLLKMIACNFITTTLKQWPPTPYRIRLRVAKCWY